MSDTPNAADDVMKLLDRGDTVILRACGLKTYYAVSVRKETKAEQIISNAVDTVIGWDGEEPDNPEDGREFDDCMNGVTETDDFTPARVLYRLTEKATTGRIV